MGKISANKKILYGINFGAIVIALWIYFNKPELEAPAFKYLVLACVILIFLIISDKKALWGK